MSVTPFEDTVELPRIVFGTSSLGNLYRAVDDATKYEIVHQTLQHSSGRVVFDSAGKYGAGLVLETLGRALSHFNSAVVHGGFLTGGDFFDFPWLGPAKPEVGQAATSNRGVQ